MRKKDGSPRRCADYRQLNAKAQRDAFPLPRIDESFNAMKGAKCFTTLDLASGYHQIAMGERDQETTYGDLRIYLDAFRPMQCSGNLPAVNAALFRKPVLSDDSVLFGGRSSVVENI